jgi:hypothetical protein
MKKINILIKGHRIRVKAIPKKIRQGVKALNKAMESIEHAKKK